MNAKDADWPSLPPIRTSSYNARVSCETLNLQPSPPCAHLHTTSNTPLSTPDHIAKPASKSADASPLGTSSPASHAFSCFPHRFFKGHRNDGGNKRGTFDAGGLFRSMFGPVVPRYFTHMSAYTGGASTPPSRGAPSSMSNSPSGRMKTPGTATSPINLMRSGGSTPHGAVLRTSKGHAGHAFTMMPPDVVGKKKPPEYESDEPKSPEVTCIGKVRRKHCKATWDALVKENGKKKKGKAKRLTGEMSWMSGELVRTAADGGKKKEGSELTVAAKLSKQRSERRQLRDVQGLSADVDVGARKRGLVQDAKALAEPGIDNPHKHVMDDGAADDSFATSIPSTEDMRAHDWMPSRGEDPGVLSSGTTEAPPSNCLLLMKKGSRNRSAHYPSDVEFVREQGHAGSQWNWGQVLT